MVLRESLNGMGLEGRAAVCRAALCPGVEVCWVSTIRMGVQGFGEGLVTSPLTMLALLPKPQRACEF